MDKSMYSLILMDELVREIDKLAHENSTSRSGLINRILAQHLSMMTPEMRIAEVFERAASVTAAETAMQARTQPSGTMMVIRSVINYKYNPAIRYSVEISIADGVYTGELRVVSRSQSGALLSRLTVFYELWCQIEETCLHERFSGITLKYAIAGGRYRRRLMALAAEESCAPECLGDSIGLYIRCFDAAMNLYFAAEQGVDMETFSAMLTLYRSYLDETPEVI